MDIKHLNASLFITLFASSCDEVSLEVDSGGPGDVPEVAEPIRDVQGANPPRDFDDYLREQVIQGTDGSWLVERDIVFSDEHKVREYYERNVLGIDSSCDELQVCPRSTVDQTGSRDNVWNVHEKLSIGYCIGNLGVDPTAYSRVKTAMDEATRDWERTADINFVHVLSEDGSGCTAGVNGVRFTVSRRAQANCPLGSTQFGAASLPDSSPGFFYLCDYGLGLNTEDLLRATKHELGHILGLAHEHIRWSQSNTTCLVGYGAARRDLTYADGHSIMGYDFCNGIADNNNNLSRGDRLGVHRLYNIAKGHGRLAGTWYEQANSFRGVGVSDDIFWYTPNGGGYQLWSTSTSTGTSATPISFTKATPGTGFMDEYSRPLGLQWHSGSDANLDREVVFFAPGSLTDKIFTNNSNGSFSASSVTINGYSIPLTGNFHNGAYSEILWWNPGNGSLLWRIDGSGNITQTTATTSYDGQPAEPLDFSYKALVGNFGHTGDQGAEILWYGDCYGWTTRGTGSTGFSTRFGDLNTLLGGECDSQQLIPLLGDFNGDNYGDIFWYGPGDRKDQLVLLYNTLENTFGSSNANLSQVSFSIEGHYKPVVADFNGDGRSDIFWYRPGSESDPLWLFNAQGGYTSITRTVTGDYAPIPGDFNTDGCDDVLWYDAVDDELIIWRSLCDGTFAAQTPEVVPANSYPVGYGIGF